MEVGAPKLYLDTSIWNIAVSKDLPDLYEATLEFFERAKAEGWSLVVSTTVLGEIKRTPSIKREKMLDLIDETNSKVSRISEEVVRLSEEYIEAGVLSKSHRNDCLHVAFATLSDCDYLISWNFQHLSNARRARRFVAVNATLGYSNLKGIFNPFQVYEI